MKALFRTKHGRLFLGKCEDVLPTPNLKKLRGKVQLIFTSPPFPLNKKKKYGNLQGEEYVSWLAAYGESFADMLSPTGSVVMEIGNAWEPGRPVQSLLPYRAFLEFVNRGGFHLCQEITYYNPARLPTPAQWVTIERIRLKDSTSKIWWMSKAEKPKASNRRVLQPYSSHMKRLLETGRYNAGTRPSEHRISATSFLHDNGGAIPSNLIEAANTRSSGTYQEFCKDAGLAPHPARMPEQLPEFFIKFLTEPGDIVLDPFAGSNTTGHAADRLKRRWVSIEASPEYACASVARFSPERAERLLTERNRQ